MSESAFEPTTPVALANYGVHDGDLAAITAEVWQSMLGDELVEGAPVPAPESPQLCGTVAISGAWSGYVELRVTFEQASAAARSMFATMTVGDSELRDALGELANMVGGSVKSLLPPPSVLSTPTVTGFVPAPASEVGPPTVNPALTVILSGRLGPVTVSVRPL